MSLPSSIRTLMGGGADAEPRDTSETIHVSSLALVKMLRHGRAGVPMEVMGLILGEFIDDFTVNISDVFSMPQSGNTVSVEAVDPVYQAEMLDMLKRTGRPEMVVGWYHSHPGFGCWLSGTDINTQQSFEQLNSRAVGIVVDPIQSVKGVIVMDCFRLINPHQMLLGKEPRQMTGNIGHCEKPSITSLIHGLNKHYHNLVIQYKRNIQEEDLLLSVMKPKWTDALRLGDFVEATSDSVKLPVVEDEKQKRDKKKVTAGTGAQDYIHFGSSLKAIHSIKKMLPEFKNQIKEDLEMSERDVMIKRVGQLQVQKQLDSLVGDLLTNTISINMSSTIAKMIF